MRFTAAKSQRFQHLRVFGKDRFEERDTTLFCDFLTRWPTLKQVKRARKASLETFFHAHKLRFAKVIEARIRAIKAAIPLTEDVAIITTHQLQALALVDQLRVTLQAIERFDAATASIAPTLPDYALFGALPGAGPTLAPRLLAAFGEQRERFAVPMTSRSIPASHPSPNAVAIAVGYTGAGSAPRSYGKRLLNGLRRRLTGLSGSAPIIVNNAEREAPIRLPAGPCLQVDPYSLPLLADSYTVR